MKKNLLKRTFPTKAAARVNLTGSDHLCAMLLAAIDDGNFDAGTMLKYRSRARQMLASPLAFSGAVDVLSVADIVVNEALRGDRSATNDQREYHTMVAAIFDGDERETVSATALQLRGVTYRAISEATLYGVAIAFELLNGGVR